MKKIILIIIILTGVLIFGQSSTTLNTNLINYPQAPETAKLLNFNEVELNNFSGQAKHTVPLFKIEEADFIQDFILSYSYAGLKIEEQNSIYGYSWNANFYGSITRSVRGLPDECNYGFFGAQNEYFKENFIYPLIENSTTTLENQLNYAQLSSIENGNYDTERDKYEVNFNGINFSFTLTDEGNPYFLSSHNYKVEIIYSNATTKVIDKFIVFDNLGHEYHFSIKEKLEPLARFDQVFNDSFQSYTISWLIEKIKLSNGKFIHYNYFDDNFESFSVNAYLISPHSEYLSYPTYNSVHSSQDLATIASTIYDFNQPKYSENYQRDLIRRKLISSIDYPSSKIDFSYSIKNNFKIINKIELKAKKNNAHHYSDLIVYDFDYVGSRNLLKSLNKNLLLLESYDYYSESSNIPFITTFSDLLLLKQTDEHGYYNGINNSSYLGVGNFNQFSNKTPNFLMTRIFALNKINYPTKGYTEIEYEQNDIKCDNNNGVCFEEPNIRINFKFKTDGPQNFNWQYNKEKSFQLTFDNATVCRLSHIANSFQNAHIQLEVFKVNGYSSMYYQNEIPSLRLQQQTSLPIVNNLYLGEILDDNHPPANPYTISHNSQGLFIISPGTYIFKISTLQNHKNANAQIVFDYYQSLFPFQKPKIKVSGIRVRKITNYKGQNEVINYKIYEYEEEDGHSTGKLINKPIKKNTIIYRLKTSSINSNGSGFYQTEASKLADEYFFKNINDDMINGVPVYYSKIKETTFLESNFSPAHIPIPSHLTSIGNNWDNTRIFNFIPSTLFPEYGVYSKNYPLGFKLKKFKEPYLNNSLTFPIIPTPNTNNKGLIENLSIYDKEGNILNETVYEYSQYYLKTPNQQLSTIFPRMKNLKIAKKVKFYQDNPLGNMSTLGSMNDLFKLGYYFDEEHNYRESLIVNKEFIQNHTLIDSTLFSYDNRNYLTEKKVVNHNGDLLKNKIYRVHNFEELNNSPLNQNRIFDKVLKSEMFQNNQIKNIQEFNYVNIINKLLMPSKIRRYKNENYIQQLLTYNFDAKPTEYKIAGNNQHELIGNNIVVIYGYNDRLPVAKIENINYSQIPSNLIAAIQQATDATNYNEQNVVNALNALRTSTDANMQKAMITTYVHKPLVGVTKITDPKGDTQTFLYDTFNRLKEVRDKDNNLLQESEYWYRTQD